MKYENSEKPLDCFGFVFADGGWCATHLASGEDVSRPVRCVIVSVDPAAESIADAVRLVGIRRIQNDGVTADCEVVHWPSVQEVIDG